MRSERTSERAKARRVQSSPVINADIAIAVRLGCLRRGYDRQTDSTLSLSLSLSLARPTYHRQTTATVQAGAYYFT